MKRMFFGFFCLSVLLFSCKNSQEDQTTENSDSQSETLTEKDISNLSYTEFFLDEKAEELVVDWVEYNQLQEVIDNIKKGDLTFFYDNDEVITTIFTDLKENIPEYLNTASIVARITAFETKFLKMKSLSNLSNIPKEELIGLSKDVFVAFSNLNLQINKKVEFDNQNIQKP